MQINFLHTLITFLIVISLFNTIKAIDSNEFEEVYLSLEDLEDSLYYKSFPYDKFATEDIIKNPKLLNDQFMVISNRKRDPVRIIEGILNWYLTESITDTFSLNRLSDNISIGEIYSKTNHFINDTSFVFREFGDKMLSNVHREVEESLSNNTIKKNSFEYKFLEKRLSDNKYIIDVPMTNVRKGLMHLKNGNLGYLIKRVWGDYPIICIFLGIAFFLVLFLIKKMLKKRIIFNKIKLK